ncbi:amidase domain-containing protein [Paenibacillus alba]|uniref:Amidase domain-containing protein n=1 Tax=Paenibacillus alba TaxID=1197127 RepID=A0ABU6G2V4_9BACL|nr:amidase domain-containing protein [Paenibacillus alba]MEC0227920.1 amidase domain-containing protein [Paenibacillus alba]
MKKVGKILATCALVSSVTISSLSLESKTFAAYDYGSVMFQNSNANVNSSFNRTKAADYAKKYATYNTRNTYYANYGSNSDGGDCTNFASQILHDGGDLPFYGTKGKNANTVDWFYYGSDVTSPTNLNGRTSSWTGAHQYRTFWGDTDSGNGRHAYSMIKYSIQDAYDHFDELNADLWPGDQVQFADSSAHTTHTVTVDSYGGGILYVSQHSTNDNNYENWFSGKNLKEIIKARKDTGTSAYVYTIKVKKSST